MPSIWKNLGKQGSWTEKQGAKSRECLQIIRRNSERITASTSVLTLSSHIRTCSTKEKKKNRFKQWLSGKESTCQCREHRKHGFSPWIGKIPCRRKWQPIPVFLPGESHGQRSLAGYSPWCCKESDATEHAHTKCYLELSTDRQERLLVFKL